MNRRNILKSVVGIPFVGLPLMEENLKYKGLLPFQAEAIKAIEDNRTSLFIWPRGSSKTFTLAKAAGVDKEKIYRQNLIQTSATGTLFVNELNEENFDLILKRLDGFSKTAVFTSVTMENQTWLKDNIDKFLFVDWRSQKDLPEVLRTRGNQLNALQDGSIICCSEPYFDPDKCIFPPSVKKIGDIFC